jgi:hypothetical protein
LAIFAGLQYRTLKGQAANQERATQALEQQAAALTVSAAALSASAQAAADEMRIARVAANPIKLSVNLAKQTPGVFNGRLTNQATVGLIVHEIAFAFGKDRIPGVAYGQANLYFNPRGSHPFSAPYDRSGRDLLILRVTGEPENGLLQTNELVFRILPSGHLQALSEPPPA